MAQKLIVPGTQVTRDPAFYSRLLVIVLEGPPDYFFQVSIMDGAYINCNAYINITLT